jgi:hypothetical protein
MAISYNIVDRSDVTTTPIKVKYSSSFSSSSLSEKGITMQIGSNGLVSITGSVPQSTVLYRTIRQLYYQQYLTGSVNNSSSQWIDSLQSTAAINSGEEDFRYFPTGSNEKINVIAVPRSTFGENFSKRSVRISSSLFDIVDDGNGNLIDFSSNPDVHVGNVIYSQGICVITNQSYINQVTASYVSWSFVAESTIYQNEVRCHVQENDFNYTLNPSANTSGSYGVYIDAVTGSSFRPYATSVGLYNAMGDLLVVAKLNVPYPIPSNTDMTYVIRWDS